MSTAFYPTNMRSMPSGGVNHGSTLQNIPYRSWKGTGGFSNPVGITASHIRPLTNKDPGNIFHTGFGLPRPIKHFRKGTVIHTLLNNYTLDNQTIEEKNLIDYNVNRLVKSSTGSSLGGGNGGTGLISQLNDMPGSFIIKENNILSTGIPDESCKICQGVGIVSDWMPINNLTEKPQPNVENPLLCCNQQRKARQRVLPTSTNVKKNYYQTTYMYLYNRCQTFQQREFNFIRGPIDEKVLNLFLKYPNITAKLIEYSKPGDPLSLYNQYVAQCNPNFTIEKGAEIAFVNNLTTYLFDNGLITEEQYLIITGKTELSITTFFDILKNILTKKEYELIVEYYYNIASNPYNGSYISGPSNPKGCAQVYYKPNNPQYAKQGAVSSSTRILKLNVDTITTNASTLSKRITYPTANQLDKGNSPSIPFILKAKPNQSCNPQVYSGNPFFFQGQPQKKNICSKNTGDIYGPYNNVFNI
jgi:hypothetical protein